MSFRSGQSLSEYAEFRRLEAYARLVSRATKSSHTVRVPNNGEPGYVYNTQVHSENGYIGYDDRNSGY